MPFPKGTSGNPTGRPHGAENKQTKRIRDWIGKFLDDNTKTLEDDILSLDPKDRVNAILQLLEYAVPKLQRIEHKDSEEGGMTLTIINHTQANANKSGGTGDA